MNTTTNLIDLGECPACCEDLKMEPDPRMRTGFALVCDNPDCWDGGGAWGANEALVSKWLKMGGEA
jgi:hypothetical protein